MAETSFAWALYRLKEGQKVTRSGWNSKGMWLSLQVPDAGSKMGHPYIYISGVDGKLVPWTPSQLDILATDWDTVN